MTQNDPAVTDTPKQVAAPPAPAAPAPAQNKAAPAAGPSAPSVVQLPPKTAAAPPAVKAPPPVGKSVPVSHPAPAAAPPVVGPQGPAIRRPASAGGLKARHKRVLASFLAVVILPIVTSAWYLWFLAADQYASTLGFSVHRDSGPPTLSMLTGLSSLTGSSSADTDIIYNYINSQQVVTEINAELDLRAIWSKPAGDFVYRLDDTGSIEDLVDYWRSMVKVYYDSSTRLIEVQVRAFDPHDAQLIGKIIYEKSTEMINRLNDIAVADTLRYAREELEKTHETVVSARQAVTAFRNHNQIVDPAADVTAQMSIVASLQQELAIALIDLDVLKDGSVSDDPRLVPLQRRIHAIEERIRAEKAKLGIGVDNATDDRAYADVVAEYERLMTDREFAEATYLSARAAFEAAQAESSRQTRYLATYVLPTLAETARYPDRPMTLGVISVFLVMLWSIATLIFYSLRDRR